MDVLPTVQGDAVGFAVQADGGAAAGGLAAAGLAYDAEDFSLLHREAHVIHRTQDLAAPGGEVFFQVLHLKDGLAHAVTSCSAWWQATRWPPPRSRRAGHFPAALLRGVGAAGGEGTAGTRCDQLRGRSLDGVEPSAAHFIQTGGGLLQAPGVGMGGLIENFIGGAGLHDAPGVEDDDALGQSRHHAHVVGDEQHRGAAAFLHLADQVQDLGLNGHVQRRGGLIGKRSPGWQASAEAIITRWRIPPENSWG